MRYPNCETVAERRKAIRDMEARVAKIYAEAESYTEFDLKRMTFAPRRVFFNDMFRMHYFYSNGREWLYKFESMMTYLAMLLIIACTIVGITSYNGVISLSTAIAVILPTIILLIPIRIYSLSKQAAKKARKLLRDLDYE